MIKKERTIIHLEINETHHYYGSIKALTLEFHKKDIGIEYGSLRNYGLSENKSYSNSKCIIRKSYLKTTEVKSRQSKEKIK